MNKNSFVTKMIILMLSVFILFGCSDDDKSVNNNNGGGNPTTNPLVGTWNLTLTYLDNSLVNNDNYIWGWSDPGAPPLIKNVDFTFLENKRGVASVTTDQLYEFDFSWDTQDTLIEFDADNGGYMVCQFLVAQDSLKLLFDYYDPVTFQPLDLIRIYIKQ